jgi:hypothetical protein
MESQWIASLQLILIPTHSWEVNLCILKRITKKPPVAQNNSTTVMRESWKEEMKPVADHQRDAPHAHQLVLHSLLEISR